MTVATEHTTREGWLLDAVDILRDELFKPEGVDIPKVQVSVAFSSRGGVKRIGECWHAKHSDGVPTIFIHPTLEATKALGVLVHEMIHAHLHTTTGSMGHGPDFRRIAKSVGLSGKMTATTETDELVEWLEEIISRKLGPYPHLRLQMTVPGTGEKGERLTSGPKKQGTRMIKMEHHCGYIARTTQKWLDEYGPTICPCDETPMTVEPPKK